LNGALVGGRLGAQSSEPRARRCRALGSVAPWVSIEMHGFDAPELRMVAPLYAEQARPVTIGPVEGGGVGQDKDERPDVQHDKAADDHDDEGKRHDRSSWRWSADGDDEKADLEGRDADVDRDAAEVDRDRARLERDRDE
jgi:hypothetical protein